MRIASLIGRLSVTVGLGVTVLLGAATRASAQGNPLGECPKSRFLSFTGESAGTGKAGSISGSVQIECDGTWIFAEVISWDEKTVTAKGDVLVIQEGLRINADHMEMDRETKYGTFFEAYGTARVTDKNPERDMFGGMEPEVMFRAEKLERIGPRSYRLTNGAFSTCVQPSPRWEMTGSSGTVTLDDHVVMRNVLLKVKQVPVLYLPYMYYPLKKENRATGFLIPAYSSSGVRGQGISNAFFWAIDRSQDATFYYDYYTKTGQGAGADYRYVASPVSQGEARFYMLDQKEILASDGTIERPAIRSYDVRGSVNQAVARHFRMIGRVYYFTDQSSQLLYQQNIYDQSRRDRDISFQLSNNSLLRGRLSLNILTQRKDYFNGAVAAQNTRLPQVDVRLAAKPLGRSKVYFGAIGQATYLDVKPDPTQPQYNRSLWRFDGKATATAPLSSLPYLSVPVAASWQITNWSESLDQLTGNPVPVMLLRNLFDLRADMVGPVVARVFQTPNLGYAERFKHIIEPRVGIEWLSPFSEAAQVIKIDPVDQLVGGTVSVNYAVVNRLLARVRKTDSVREMLSLSIGQSYYSNAAAAKIDPNYSSATAGTYSPVQILAAFSPLDDVSARFQMQIDPIVRAVRSYSATAVISRPRLQLQGGWSKRQYLPTVPGFDNPTSASHFLNANATVRTSDGRFGGTYGFNYDLRQNNFLQQRLMGYYSTQCCGFSVDYQTVNIAQFGLSSVTHDRRIAVNFTLAGIGSFATPLGAFGR